MYHSLQPGLTAVGFGVSQFLLRQDWRVPPGFGC
jgi:hypothetical protein